MTRRHPIDIALGLWEVLMRLELDGGVNIRNMDEFDLVMTVIRLEDINEDM